jgi:hypothetical protein
MDREKTDIAFLYVGEKKKAPNTALFKRERERERERE